MEALVKNTRQYAKPETEQIKTREEWGENFSTVFKEFNQRLKNDTLHELPSLSEGLAKWKKWAEEVDNDE